MVENQEVHVLDEQSMVRRWLTVKVDSHVMTQAEANRFWDSYARGGSRYLATYFATVGDVMTLTKLANDLGTPPLPAGDRQVLAKPSGPAAHPPRAVDAISVRRGQ